MAAPPVAKKVRHEMEMFGDVRTDDYYWLRDDSRSDPEILSYLKEENDYTSQAMSGHKQLEDHIYIEMRGRIKEDDISTPIRRGASPNNKLIAYAEDTKGNEIYSIYVIDADKENYHMDLGKLHVNDSLRNKIDSLDYAVVIVPFINVKIQDFQLYSEYVAVYEREDGLPKLTIYSLPPIGEAIGLLQKGQVVDFLDPAYSVDPMESEFFSSILRYSYSSMKTPPSVYDHDMKLGISVLKKRQEVLGGFEESDYMTERKWAIASDGTKVPVSILYKMNNVKLDGSDPLLLYGYGSYEACVDPSFIASRLSFVDRGFVYAIAHIRGGGEMGRRWYEDGKLLKKKNTFTDFIACAEYLIQNKYCTKEKLCINGRSAGGLLIGAVLNMRPDLFKAAVAGVPFVDVVTTMLDPTIPLTTSEWEEWGDPRIEEYYYYMKSYSPVDNVKAQNYPNILVTAGLNDPRVLYSEPAKYVAKLRATKTDDNLLLFKCELGAGHFSKSGRFEKLQEEAFACAFILKALDLSS
ncbi:hypothetical protein HPP92_021750 [Vanilla planifolia]|uniref:Prolyl endopeptidase n=1 Tax=Vanilla planifolia TaxID=51239 RepID=A0A835PZ71_VANPL|nr:hypothetical protein HPP92_021750 [Vanilla planifolia]